MMRLKLVILTAVAALAMPLAAHAGWFHKGCDSCGEGHHHHGHLEGHGGNGACTNCGAGHAGHGFHQPPFQAAPWYLYYPYDQHFQMPAPIGAPFYAPQAYGHPSQNAYFPPGYGAQPMPAVR